MSLYLPFSLLDQGSLQNSHQSELGLPMATFLLTSITYGQAFSLQILAREAWKPQPAYEF